MLALCAQLYAIDRRRLQVPIDVDTCTRRVFGATLQSARIQRNVYAYTANHVYLPRTLRRAQDDLIKPLSVIYAQSGSEASDLGNQTVEQHTNQRGHCHV